MKQMLPVLCAAVAFVAPCAAIAQMNAAPPGVAAQDTAFAKAAAQGGLAEVSDAHLALRKSMTASVVAFAQRMIVDHGAANTKLAKIAKQQNIALPDGVGEANVAMAKKLAALDGAAFDAAYMKGQVIAHEQTIALFKREIADGKDVLLVGFAKTTLPTVEQHLAMLQTKMESSM